MYGFLNQQWSSHFSAYLVVWISQTLLSLFYFFNFCWYFPKFCFPCISPLPFLIVGGGGEGWITFLDKFHHLCFGKNYFEIATSVYTPRRFNCMNIGELWIAIATWITKCHWVMPLILFLELYFFITQGICLFYLILLSVILSNIIIYLRRFILASLDFKDFSEFFQIDKFRRC